MQRDPPHPILKPKDLCGIPWRLALALQADGWWLRQDIIWHKPNPMPESCRDRCTKAHEYLFLLVKNGAKSIYWIHARKMIRQDTQPKPDYIWIHKETKEESTTNPNDKKNWDRVNLWEGRAYWYDAEAIKEESSDPEGSSNRYKSNFNSYDGGMESGAMSRNNPIAKLEFNGKRNKRSVWTVATQPFPEAHFATFPEKLIEPCILAGCPEWVCPKCGKARERIIKRQTIKRKRPNEYIKRNGAEGTGNFINQTVAGVDTQTTGWTDCGCGVEFVPGIVLDPFMGAGTTGLVAWKNRRDFIGIELKPEYKKMAEKRIQDEKDKMGLFP